MASDLGLTTWALSPSASFSSTGRMSPRLERGGSEFLPKPAARPDVQRVGREGDEVDGRVRCLARSGPAGSRSGVGGEGFVRVARLVHGFGLRIQGTHFPRIRAGAIFAQKNRKKERIQESAFKRLAASCSSSTGLPG